MSRSTAISVSQPVPIRRSRIGLIALWGLQLGLAALFLLASGSKLVGAPAMVTVFAAIGVGQWFRYVTGLIEVVSAVALLVPAPTTNLTSCWKPVAAAPPTIQCSK